MMRMMRKHWLAEPLLLMAAAWCMTACEDDMLEEHSIGVGEGMLFAATTREWGAQNRDGGSLTRNGEEEPKIRVIPIEGESNVYLQAIQNDNFGEVINTLVTAPENGDATRGLPKDEVATNQAFTLAAYYDENGKEQTLIDKKSVIFDHRDEAENINYWKLDSDETVYWKLGSQAITTYAWWPQALNFSATDKKFNYEVPTAVTDQEDFLYAYVKPTYYTVHKSADLTFNHALTAVRFALGKALTYAGGPGYVTSITLTNLYYKGTFDPSTGTWAIDKTVRKDFTIDIAEADQVAMNEGATNVVINPEKYTLLMLPQDLGESPTEAIFTMRDGRQFRATLNHGGVWEPGKTVTYQLSGEISVGYVIYASAHEATYLGAGASLSVTSYQLQGSTPVAQRWKVTGYSIDNGTYWNAPEATTWRNSAGTVTMTPWITTRSISDKDSGNGTTASTVNITANASPQSSASGTGETINNALASTQFINYDLSTYNAATNGTVSRTTANCYIVRGYGTFTFPAAYGGGAIKNGSTNASAYSPTNFVNYKGNHITAPYIQDDTKTTPASAKIVWAEQPVYNAITNMTYNPETKMVSFTVPKDQVYQGNAVVGVFDSNDVCMWSWHLWFTTATAYYPPITVATGYSFAPNHLGTVYTGRVSVYNMREVMLKIEQIDDDGNVIKGSSMCTIYVSQTSGQTNTQALLNVYYQWGRKDPRPIGWNNIKPSNNNRSYKWPTGWISANPVIINGYNWYQSGAQITMQDAIRHPNAWKYRYETIPSLDWCTPRCDNWWNCHTNNTAQTVYSNSATDFTKTVYDPCPAGYHVPQPRAFAAITWDAGKDNLASYNADNSSILYRRYHVNGKDIYFYHTGYYWRGASNSNIGDFNNNTWSWCSGAYDQHNAWAFYTHLTGVSPGNTAQSRCHGMPIRPLAD